MLQIAAASPQSARARATTSISLGKFRCKKVQLELNVVAAHRDAKGWRDLPSRFHVLTEPNHANCCRSGCSLCGGTPTNST